MCICRVCGREFKAITNTHLASHNITLASYIQTYPGSRIDSQLRLAKAIEANLGWGDRRPYQKEAISKAKKGKKLSEHHRQRCSEGQKKRFQRERPWHAGKPLPESYRKILSDAHKGKPLSKSHRLALIEARRRWAKTTNKPPTWCERWVIENLPLDLTYTGKGSMPVVDVDGRCKYPDFCLLVDGVLVGVVEVFGDYWHKGQNTSTLVDWYSARASLPCLVLWESTIKTYPDWALMELREFVSTILQETLGKLYD